MKLLFAFLCFWTSLPAFSLELSEQEKLDRHTQTQLQVYKESREIDIAMASRLAEQFEQITAYLYYSKAQKKLLNRSANYKGYIDAVDTFSKDFVQYYNSINGDWQRARTVLLLSVNYGMTSILRSKASYSILLGGERSTVTPKGHRNVNDETLEESRNQLQSDINESLNSHAHSVFKEYTVLSLVFVVAAGVTIAALAPTVAVSTVILSGVLAGNVAVDGAQLLMAIPDNSVVEPGEFQEKFPGGIFTILDIKETERASER